MIPSGHIPINRSGSAAAGILVPVFGLTIGNWEIAHKVSEGIEVIAVAVIAVAVVIAVVLSIHTAVTSGTDAAYEIFKHKIARGLLVGLDLLIAADIIRTVTLQPTLENVAALGLLVVVRTFLSWALQLEDVGRWPWQTPAAGPEELEQPAD